MNSIITSAEARQDWSSYKVLDIHGHIGTFSGYDLSLPTLLEQIHQHHVRMVLVSNIDGAELSATANLKELDANAATAKAVKEHADVLRGIAWARPEDGSAANMTSSLNELDGQHHHIFVGIKFHPEFNNFAADDARVDPYLELCSHYKIPAVFHCGGAGSNSDPAKIYTLARRHPTVPIVLYHMGFGTDHSGAIKVVSESIKHKDANLYLDTAQVDAQTVLAAVHQLGADRILFGTDATYFGHSHYQHYEELVELLRKKLPRAEFDKVMYGNAVRLFSLQL